MDNRVSGLKRLIADVTPDWLFLRNAKINQALNLVVMRLLYSCSELGLGHAARTIALGKQLEQRGHEVFFFSGGKAYDLLRKEFKRVFPITPVAWYENGSGILTSASLINILFPLPKYNREEDRLETKNCSAMETINRYYDLRKYVKRIKPDILLADGDMHALRLAHRWKIPDIYITNVVRPSMGFSSLLTPGERLTEQYVKKCRKIIIPDNKLPYTISEYNIGNLHDVGIVDKTEFVGSFFDTKPTEVSEQHIFAPVSGPYGTRAKLLQMLVPILDQMEIKSIVSLGIPGEPKTVKRGNCEIHSWMSAHDRQKAMKGASIVLFSGGHITCFETIKYAKPTICIPTQPEQLANAAKLQDMYCSMVAKNKEQLERALYKTQLKHQEMKESVQVLNRFSNKFDGLKRAVEIVEEIGLAA